MAGPRRHQLLLVGRFAEVVRSVEGLLRRVRRGEEVSQRVHLGRVGLRLA